MTKIEFIKELAEVLMVKPEELGPDTELRSFEGWDSTAVLNLVVLLDEQGVTVEEEKIPDCKTVQEVMDLAGSTLN